MHIILDLLLLCIIVFSMVFYYRKGFAASIVGLFRFVIAAAVALIFSNLLAGVFLPALEKALGKEGALSAGRGTASYIAYVIAFVMIFVITLLVLKLVENLLHHLIRKLPVIGFFDGLVGGVVGILVGFFTAELIVELYAALAGYVGGVFRIDAVYESVLAKFLYENNLFALIFKSVA